MYEIGTGESLTPLINLKTLVLPMFADKILPSIEIHSLKPLGRNSSD